VANGAGTPSGEGAGGWSMAVRPANAHGRKGAFRVTLLNQTPTPAAVSLVAHDVEDALDVRIEPEGPVIVPPGCESLVSVRVALRPGQRGGPGRSYPLEFHGVQLGREGAADPSLLRQARFTYAPRFGGRAPRWSRRILAVTAVAALALALLAFAGVRALRHAPNTTATPTVAPTAAGPVGVTALPAVERFTALTGQLGHQYVLVWRTSNATLVSLNGQAVVPSGSQTVSAPAAAKTYVLEARDRAGHVDSRTVTLIPTPTPAPAATPPALPAGPPPRGASGAGSAQGAGTVGTVGRNNVGIPAAPSLATPAAQGPLLIVNPVAVSFPTGATGAAATRTVHLANLGPGSVTVTGVTVEGTDAGAYRAGGACRGQTLNPTDGCSIQVTLVAGGGRRDATLVITDTTARSPHRVTLRAAP